MADITDEIVAHVEHTILTPLADYIRTHPNHFGPDYEGSVVADAAARMGYDSIALRRMKKSHRAKRNRSKNANNAVHTMISNAYEMGCRQLERQEYDTAAAMVADMKRKIMETECAMFDMPHAKRARLHDAMDRIFNVSDEIQDSWFDPIPEDKTIMCDYVNRHQGAIQVVVAKDYWNRTSPMHCPPYTLDMIVAVQGRVALWFNVTVRAEFDNDGVEIGLSVWNGQEVEHATIDTGHHDLRDAANAFLEDSKTGDKKDRQFLLAVIDGIDLERIAAGVLLPDMLRDQPLPWILSQYTTMESVWNRLIAQE